MKFRLALLALALGSFLLDRSAHAYPSFVGYGYTNCMACHYNPDGGGPLTDYGRALWATTIGGRTFISKKVTDETLGKRSGFLGSVKMPPWLRPSVDFRWLSAFSQLGTDSMGMRHIPMLMDASVVLKGGKSDRFWTSLTAGLVPQTKIVSGVVTPYFVLASREHYLGVRVIKPLRLYLGKMDQAFGIRVPDHTAFSRSMTGVAQNDQTYALAAHTSLKRVEFTAQLFTGDFIQDPDLWQKGFSTMVEVELSKKARLGASQLWSRNQYYRRLNTALHARIGVGNGHSFLVEAGSLRPKILFDGVSATQAGYFFYQSSQRLARGFHLLQTLEFYREEFSSLYPLKTRISPGFQWMPWQRVEVRTDLTYALQSGTDQATFPGTWGLVCQLVLSL